jgi:hypothetical protein
MLANLPDINNINSIVLPLSLSKASMDKTKTFKFLWSGHSFSPTLAEIVINDQFPFELGFAMTNHKCQGRTMSHVILTLSSRPTKQMEFAAIYVAMSRVKCSNNIRLLFHCNSDINDSLKYISMLHANPMVLLFYAGFGNNNNSTWDSTLALSHYHPKSNK